MVQSSNGGAGTLSLLGILFIGLKLGGLISWSWWWVLLPFYGGFSLLMVILMIAMFIHILADK